MQSGSISRLPNRSDASLRSHSQISRITCIHLVLQGNFVCLGESEIADFKLYSAAPSAFATHPTTNQPCRSRPRWPPNPNLTSSRPRMEFRSTACTGNLSPPRTLIPLRRSSCFTAAERTPIGGIISLADWPHDEMSTRSIFGATAIRTTPKITSSGLSVRISRRCSPGSVARTSS